MSRWRLHPRQLPLRLRRAVDRMLEQATIEQEARQARAEEAPALLKLTGPGGVGKTTLAVQACHAVKDNYPDAQLFFTMTGASADDAVIAFLRSMGFSGDEIPATPQERVLMFRSELADRRALMVLDDVESAEQVTPLLFDSPTALIVVTSRRQLAGLRDAEFIDVPVKPFPVEPAGELITVLSNRVLEPEVVHGMCDVCDGLPLALRIVGTRLSDPYAKPEDLLEQLSGERPHEALEYDEGDQPVAKVYELAYQSLTPEQARVYLLASFVPGPHFGPGVVAAVLGVDEPAARRALRELADRHVIDQFEQDRFRFHQLVRAHARDRARATYRQTELMAAVDTARRWYLNRQVALDKSLSPRPFPIGATEYYEQIDRAYGPGDERAWAEVEREWPNLLAAMAPGDQIEDELAGLLPLTLWFFAYQTRRCTELIDAYLRLVETASTAAQSWQFSLDLAGLYERCGEYEAALEWVRKAAESGHEPGYERVHTWHGLALEARGDLPAALESFGRAIAAIPLMRDPVQEERARALLHMHVARVRMRLEDFADVAELLPVAEEFFTTHHELPNLARVRLDLGKALARNGSRSDAAVRLERAFDGFTKLKMTDKAAEAAAELAHIAEDEAAAARWRAKAQELGS